ncbi:MAG: DUF1634 domain-containing protein [Nitrososphaerota archaeon]|nr:DUF1634 domain-containing protein [Nitrososphaerota archaeon]
MDRRESEFNTVIGLVLRYGVMSSFAIIAVGSVLLFVEGQTGYYPLGSAEQLFERQNRFLIGIVPLLQGVAAAKPYAIIDLGLLVLLATPIARVFISIFLFFEERRYAFVLITLVVLGLLLFSTFVLGPFLGG